MSIILSLIIKFRCQFLLDEVRQQTCGEISGLSPVEKILYSRDHLLTPLFGYLIAGHLSYSFANGQGPAPDAGRRKEGASGNFGG